MHPDNRDTLITVVVIVFVFISIFAGISLYSNHSPPFSVVVSQSMQHDDDESRIGVIDTGDIVLVRNKSKVEIQSYLEGYQTGHSTFGDYGTVIIYKTNNGISIIHRAMMYIEINEDIEGKYAYIPYLDEYPIKSSIEDIEKIRENFFIERTGYREGDKINVCLENILNKSNVGDVGYITMGDNNTSIDQCNMIPGVKGLVTYEQISSIPVMEIPWLGCFKILLKDDSTVIANHAPNSLPDLAVVIISGILTLLSLYSLHIVYYMEKSRRNKR